MAYFENVSRHCEISRGSMAFRSCIHAWCAPALSITNHSTCCNIRIMSMSHYTLLHIHESAVAPAAVAAPQQIKSTAKSKLRSKLSIDWRSWRAWRASDAQTAISEPTARSKLKVSKH
eukprot:6214346-Pleurochrysis_carterae.AAC.5